MVKDKLRDIEIAGVAVTALLGIGVGVSAWLVISRMFPTLRRIATGPIA